MPLSQVKLVEIPGYIKLLHDAAVNGGADEVTVTATEREILKFIVTEQDELQIPELMGAEAVYLVYKKEAR